MQKVDQFTPENFAQKCLLKLHIDELFSGHFLAIKNQNCPKCYLYVKYFTPFCSKYLISQLPKFQKSRKQNFQFLNLKVTHSSLNLYTSLPDDLLLSLANFSLKLRSVTRVSFEFLGQLNMWMVFVCMCVFLWHP